MTYQGHFQNGVIVLDEPVNLPDGAKVRVELITDGAAGRKTGVGEETQFEHYESIIGAIDDLPEDFAGEHDHYIHGTPKK